IIFLASRLITFDPFGVATDTLTVTPRQSIPVRIDLFHSNLAITPDGNTFICVSDGRVERYTTIPRMVPAGSFAAPRDETGVLFNVRCFPDSKRVLCWGLGRSICVIDIDGGQILRTLKLKDSVSSAAISPDGKFVGVALRSGVEVIDLKDDRRIDVPAPGGF